MGKVLNCSCSNLFQDMVYGKGKRYHVSMMKNRELVGFRCTICGHKADASPEDKKTTKVERK